MGGKLSNKLVGISSFTTQTIYELRDTIWAMNKQNITFEDLQTRITNFINNAKIASANTSYSFKIDKDVNQDYTFTSVQGMNIYRIIQEAINNALKYAKASKIEVLIKQQENKLIVTICDNGIGYNKDKINLGNGLINMEKRTRDIKGLIKTTTEEGKGTTISIDFLLNN
jgi:signal transduction histidine kinase